eukprot:4714620-Amphidinium_carterae.1
MGAVLSHKAIAERMSQGVRTSPEGSIASNPHIHLLLLPCRARSHFQRSLTTSASRLNRQQPACTWSAS